MTTFVLDANDADLRIAAGGTVVARAPGFAALGSGELLLGRDAVHQFRLRPREASNLFWHRLDTEPLTVPHAQAANHADLVFRQLERLGREAGVGADDELIVAAPATMTTAQLSLLLGIAEGVGLRVTGIVDAAVVASATQDLPARFQHVDISLHRVVVTRIDGGDQVRRTGVQDVTECSISTLLDAWINLIADRFVRETRFDPLSIADTEQQLYDQTYAWLTADTRTALLNVTVERQGVQRRIEVATASLVEKTHQRYALLDRALDGTPVVLSHRAAALPGLRSYLSARVPGIEALPTDAVFAGAARHLDAIRSGPDNVRLVTRLPSAGVRRDASRPSAQPTHLLFDATAVQIGAGVRIDRALFPDLPPGYTDGAAAIAIDGAGARLSLAPGVAAAVDGRPAPDGVALTVGATVEVGGVRLRLIRVMDRA